MKFGRHTNVKVVFHILRACLSCFIISKPLGLPTTVQQIGECSWVHSVYRNETVQPLLSLPNIDLRTGLVILILRTLACSVYIDIQIGNKPLSPLCLLA